MILEEGVPFRICLGKEALAHTEHPNQVAWRNHKVHERCSNEYRQREIPQVLQVGLATINSDVTYLRRSQA